MNDEAARQGRPDTDHLAFTLSATSALTPLQTWTKAIFATLADARDVLSDDAYRALVEIVSDRLGFEVARLVAGEFLRATREPAA